jgi:hypothetical protein
MDDATRLFGLKGFRVVSVASEAQNGVRVVVETVELSAGLPRLWGDLQGGEGPPSGRSRAFRCRVSGSRCGGANAG